ncbi:MAG: hypothetical protein WD673_07470 [Alphaproteobacteria bacterium]
MASETIAEATGAEAGCVTGCAAAGISVAVAACMTGCDLAAIGRLPDATGLRRDIVMQRGHDFSSGATAGQIVTLPGARLVMVGDADACSAEALRQALTPDVAAALYVVGDLDVSPRLVDLPTFAATCHADGVPVIVDAAAQHGLRSWFEDGADLMIKSAQKIHAGLTAGIIAGRLDLVRACLLNERGVGRPMKAGKEGVVGAIAALRRWRTLDPAQQAREWARRAGAAAECLRAVRGLDVAVVPDPLGNPFERVRVTVDPIRAGLNAWQLGAALEAGEPGIVVWAYDVARGFILLDPRPCTDEEMALACRRIAEIVAASPASAPAVPPPAVGDAAYFANLLAWPERPRRATV